MSNLDDEVDEDFLVDTPVPDRTMFVCHLLVQKVLNQKISLFFITIRNLD